MIGERRAVAAVIFAFYFINTLMNAWLGGGPLAKVMFSLAGVYGLAFFALVAGYFWARWYSVGVGLFGVIVAVVGCWQLKTLEPVFVFVGATHLLAAGFLWGDTMAEPYEGQKAWRDRYHMDDNAVQRLGRSVIRAGVSLPFVLMYAFTPKPEGDMAVLGFLALALTGVGFAGLVKMKTWGILSLAAAGTVLLLGSTEMMASLGVGSALVAVSPLAIGGMLLASAAPFARPMGRWIAAR